MASLTHERFEALAEAYGGDVARWPADVRDAAALLMSEEPVFTGAVLARAGALDAALDSWRPAAASPALIDRIVGAAPNVKRPRWLAWASPAALAGGLAAACAAGVLVGVEVNQRTVEAREVAVTNTLTAVASPFDLEAGA